MMDTSRNASSDSGVCHNHCQLGRELISGGLLAGGVFWIIASLAFFAAEMIGVSAVGIPVTSPFLGFLASFTALLKNVVGDLPGYRMILALAGATMLIQSRALSSMMPHPLTLILSGLVGLAVQIYNGLGGVLIGSVLFSALIVAGMVLSIVWIRGEKKDRNPVFVDSDGRHFIRQKAPSKPPEAMGLFSSARPASTVDDSDHEQGEGESVVTSPAVEVSSLRGVGGDLEKLDSELPPMPDSKADNVAEFPLSKQAGVRLAHIGQGESEHHAAEVPEPVIDRTQEIEQPVFADVDEVDTVLTEEISIDSEVPELEKTVVIERPDFLDEPRP